MGIPIVGGGAAEMLRHPVLRPDTSHKISQNAQRPLLSSPLLVRSICRIVIGSLDLHDPHNAIAVIVGPFLSHLGKNLIQTFGCGLDVLQPNVTSQVNGLFPTIG
jgi:hypothetical protein